MLHSWKFAANGVWEEALTLDATKPTARKTIADWVAAQPQNVAFEAIFAETDMPSSMYGIRLTALSKAEQASRIADIIDQSDRIQTESDFLKIAAPALPEFPLFTEPLKALNIGIVSQWYSVGPQIIWDKDSAAPLSFTELQQKAPRFFDRTQNPVAIEFWYTQPIDHWYKIYVSDAVEGGYAINVDKYARAITRLPEFAK